MEGSADLAWDYTGDESSPLLQRSVSPLFRHDDSCKLTRRQTQFMLHCLTESVQILNATSRYTANDISRVEPRASGTPGRVIGRLDRLKQSLSTVYRNTQPYLALVIVGLQMITTLLETFWDLAGPGDGSDPLTTISQSLNPSITQQPSRPHRHIPVIEAIVCSICCILLCLVYVDLMYKLRHGRLTFFSWFCSCISSLLVFAGLYTTFYRFSPSSFHTLISLQSSPYNDAASHPPLFIVSFLSFLHYAISVFCLNQSAFWVAVSWFTITATTVQMLISYGHVVILVSHVTHILPPPSLSLTSHTIPADDSTSLRRDPGEEADTDSLLYYPPHSSLVEARGDVSSYRTAPGAYDTLDAPLLDATEPVSIENENSKNISEDDMLLRNSV